MPSRPLARWLFLSFALLVACRKPQPSPEYQEAVALHASLYAQHLDDAYLDPEMDRVEALFQKVPDNSRDHAAAQAELARIRAAREKARAEQVERQKAIEAATAPSPPIPGIGAPSYERAPGASEEATDAGPVADQPAFGMAVDEFRKKFGGCFNPHDPIEVQGRGSLEAFELRNLPSCRASHPQYEQSLLLVQGGKVFAALPKKNLQVEFRQADGGAPPPRPSYAPDAGAR